MSYKLKSAQKSLLSEIIAEGKYIKDPKARRVFERAATQTAIVESGIANLSGGDADSAGWRQERASLYKDPTSVKNSARRFRQEFEAAYKPGMKSYDLAAAIQRPREDLRGRYKEEAKNAESALAQLGKAASAAAATTAGASRSSRVVVPGTKTKYLPEKIDTNAALVDSLLSRRKGESILAAASRGIASGEYTTPASTVEGTPEVRLPAAADAPSTKTSRSAQSGGKPGGGWGGSEGLLIPWSKRAHGRGLTTTSAKRSGSPAGGAGTASDHHVSQTDASARDWSGDTKAMAGLSKDIAAYLGVKRYRYGGADINVTRNGYRYQLITRPHGTGPHVHLGIRKVG